MPDNAGFYLWLLLMLFIVGLLGTLTVLIWRSEKKGHFKQQRPPLERRNAARVAPEDRREVVGRD